MNNLFSPFKLKSINLKNRIALPPLCQFMAEEGVPNSWHFAHYAQIAYGGVGLVVVEATGVSSEGRISPKCLGIWNEEQKIAHKKLVKEIKDGGAVAGIQIAHAGRKANSEVPWDGAAHIPENDPRALEIFAPSAIAFDDKSLTRVPKEMTIEDIKKVQNDFVNAAKNALEAGYEWLELHFAHGYLASSFFSNYANQRTDEYGKEKGKFLLETLKAVREVWPEHLPLTARLGVIEFDDKDEENLAQSIELIKQFKENGLDMINVSMGFNTLDTKIPWGSAFMVPVTKKIRDEVNIPVATAWGLGQAELANNTIINEELDIVMVGKTHFVNPHWTYIAAKELKIEKPERVLPTQYAFWLEKYKV